MTRTMILFGRRVGAKPGIDEAALTVNWSEAANFHDVASHLIAGEYENAVVMPVNSTPGCGENAAVRITIDRAATNFKGFRVRFWLCDKPYASEYQGGDLEPFDFDWVAYIPCASFLTG